jgi:excisionase family DNA binding protein
MRERIFSTHEVASMVGTNPSSVVRWIEAGKLKAFKTPGGHRRVREIDLRAFFAQFNIPPPSDFEGSGGRRIVVVDPDGRAASALARSLRKADENLDVTTAADAVDALLRVGVAPPMALVIDAGSVDTASVARALKNQPATASVALVALVSRADPDGERKLRAAGAKAVLARPASAEQILGAVSAR